MRFSDIFFDLDGTLTDSKEGITKSVQHTLRHFGIEVADLSELICFAGPPVKDALKEYYGFSEEESDEGLEVYREYFEKTGMFQNRVYPGIPELLERLRDAGARLTVATCKPEYYARQILAHFGLDRYFHFLSGAELHGGRNEKPEVIAHALESLNISDVRRVAMVGDRKYDVLGAKQFRIAAIGVLYGYGSREELEAAGADMLAEDIPKLERILLGQT